MTSAYGSVCVQVVSPDLKVHKLATIFKCMDVVCILNKLDTCKSIRLPTFGSFTESVSQSNEGQVCIDHNDTSVASPTMVNPVIENVYTRSNFIHPFPNLLTDPSQN